MFWADSMESSVQPNFTGRPMLTTAPMPQSALAHPAKPGPDAVLPCASVPAALDAERRWVAGPGPRIALYLSAPEPTEAVRELTPLVLVHSVNAAASAAEVRPLFERYRATRVVVALELPGFGSSERGPLEYTPKTMTDAILRVLEYLRRAGFQSPVDLMAVSLSCEFAAYAAVAKPDWFRSIGLVSPTGLESRWPQPYDGGRTKEKSLLRAALEMPLWSQALYWLLTTRASMRYFLKRTWGSTSIDERLLAYNLLTARQPGARYAPLAFLSGALFTRGIARVYARLPQPLWVAHGVRGDFTGYEGLAQIGPLANRTIDVFGTGALPYFETPSLFASRYDAFLQNALKLAR